MTLEHLKAKERGCEQDVISSARAVVKILERDPTDVEWCVGMLDRALKRLDLAAKAYLDLMQRMGEMELEASLDARDDGPG